VESLPGEPVVLVVDDDQAILGVLPMFLRNCCVLCANDGQEALAVARGYSGTIDLLITDIDMPGLKGTELAARLIAERPDTRVILMTGSGAENVTLPLLKKPFGADTLMTKMREVLAASVTEK